MQLAKMTLKAKPMFGVKSTPKAKFRERFLARLEKAQKAYRKRMRQGRVPFEALTLPEEKKVVGWLVPKDAHLDVRQFELASGINYIMAGDSPKVETKKPNTDNPVKVIAENGQLFLNADGTLEPKFHGDEIIIGAHAFIIKVLSSKACLHWLAVAALSLCASVAALPSQAKADDVSSAKETVHALTGSPFTLAFAIKGLEAINAEQVQAKLTVDKKEYPFKVLNVEKSATENIILVDNSSLCVHRRMEDTLNLELTNLIKSFSPDASISLVEFSRRSDTENVQEVYRKRHENVAAKELLKTTKLIRCESEARSVNALDAILQHKDLILPSGDDANFSRRRLFVITSGNVRPTEGVKELISAAHVELYPIAYSGIALEYVEKIFSEIGSPTSPFLFTWWLKAEPLNLTAQLTYDYKFELQDSLPEKMNLASPYTVEVSYKHADQPLQFFADVKFSLDEARLARKRLILAAVCVISLLMIAYLLYRIIKYYRTPVCSVSGKVMSRAWNASLHDIKPHQPVLYIEDDDGYLKAHVIKKQLVTIGSGFSADVRLPASLIPFDLRLSWTGSETFTLQAQSTEKLVSVNGIIKIGPVNIGHTDVIQLGHTKLHFLFSA